MMKKYLAGLGLFLLIFVALSAPTAQAATTPTFAAKVDYIPGNTPVFVAIGDLNGDGKADLVVANGNSNTVSVFLNNGNDTLAAKVDYATGVYPGSIAIGDLNGDGKVDLAVTNLGSSTSGSGTTVSVLLNNGNGTFATKVDYTTGTRPSSVAISDFNGDGKADLATTNYYSGTISVFLNNGNGTFAAKVDYTAAGTGSIVVGDFNGDGKADLAVASDINPGAAVSVFLNNGNGTFATKVDYTANPLHIVVGDFNGDGKADLAVTESTGSSSGNTVSIFLNNGNGTFAAKVGYTMTSSGYVAVGDLNGDGKADLAVTNASSNTVSVFSNNGDGTFAAKVDYAAGTYPGSIAVGDLNYDGKADLAVTNSTSGTVSVLLNTTVTTSDTTAPTTTATPSVDLRVDGSNGPVSKAFGSYATVSWTLTNTTSAATCTASASGSDDWNGSKSASGGSGSYYIGSVKTDSVVYTLTCTESGTTFSDSVTVNQTSSATTATTCSFTRYLKMGSVGDDVKCLQQYLNSTGFIIAGGKGVSTSAKIPGSAGYETTYFGKLVTNAVKGWQAANSISPANGYFGCTSINKYNSLTGATTLPSGCKKTDTTTTTGGTTSGTTGTTVDTTTTSGGTTGGTTGTTNVTPTVQIWSNQNPIASGSHPTISWIAKNAVSCNIYANDAFWASSTIPHGSAVTPDSWPMNAPVTFKAVCTNNPNGPKDSTSMGSASILVKIADTATPVVTISSSQNPIASGSHPTITWSSTNASSCNLYVDGILWMATTIAGSAVTLPGWSMNVPVTFSAVCGQEAGTGTGSASVNVKIATPAPNITSTSAKGAGNFEMDAGGTATIYARNIFPADFVKPSSPSVFIGGIQAVVIQAYTTGSIVITVPSSLTAGQSYGMYVLSAPGVTSAGGIKSNIVSIKILSSIAGSPTTDTTAPTTTASPVGGTYSSTQSVTLTANETATIYYTTDGTTPTTASTVYSGAISISSTKTLKFFAKDSAGNNETVKTESYTISSATITDTTAPTVTVTSGTSPTVSNGTPVTINWTSTNATACTIVNVDTTGSWPRSTAGSYTSLNLTAQQSYGVKCKNSSGVESNYIIVTVNVGAATTDTTAPTTTASPVGGTYSSTQSVTLTANETATIYYTTDGTTPTTASTVYSGAISISSTKTLKFFAKDSAGNNETVNSVTYTISAPATAILSVSSSVNGTFGSSASITSGSAATLKLITTNAATCKAGNQLSGTIDVAGSGSGNTITVGGANNTWQLMSGVLGVDATYKKPVTPTIIKTIYSIGCQNSAGTNVQSNSVTVTVTAPTSFLDLVSNTASAIWSWIW